jgi:hypothetical protein
VDTDCADTIDGRKLIEGGAGAIQSARFVGETSRHERDEAW